MISNNIFGQSASGKVGNGWFHLIIYACVCEILGRCIFCIFCIFPVVRHVLFGKIHPCRFGKMEYRSQVHLSMAGRKRIGEYPFGMFALVLGGHPAQAMKKLASRFTTIRCDGERQLYIFGIRGRNICSRSFNRLCEAA